MAAPGQKKKRVPTAKGLANLRPNPQHLKRGGKKPRAFLDPVELQFCQFKAEGATDSDAARWAGVPSKHPAQWAYDQHKRPLIEETIAIMQKKIMESAIDAVVERREERDRLTHREYGHRLRTMKTHKYRGDESIVRLIEIGFRSTGAIQPNRTSATAVAGGGSVGDVGLVDIYKPLWLRNMEAELAAKTKAQYGVKQLEAAQQIIPPQILSTERAKEYLVAAGGDKERAREAARKDGWQV